MYILRIYFKFSRRWKAVWFFSLINFQLSYSRIKFNSWVKTCSCHLWEVWGWRGAILEHPTRCRSTASASTAAKAKFENQYLEKQTGIIHPHSHCTSENVYTRAIRTHKSARTSGSPKIHIMMYGALPVPPGINGVNILCAPQHNGAAWWRERARGNAAMFDTLFAFSVRKFPQRELRK